jgi:arylsulfatase A-like enzyme
MSGLYPPFTGADKNNAVMDESITTFANVLKEQGNYQTSYLGKWHLSGEGKPGWNDPGRSFGFDNTRFKYNRGHWKYFEAEEDSWKVHEYEIDGEANFVGSLDKHYASDFLFYQGISDIKKALDKDQPFAMVLSIPDPHGPNNVRPPFRNRYNYDFEYPPSGISAIRKDPAPPKWNNIDHEEIDVNDAEQYISDYEKSDEWQEYMRQYFGMVACIDENVGKLLSFLTTRGIDDNTIIVFTSDHGDLLGEHGKMNKGRSRHDGL